MSVEMQSNEEYTKEEFLFVLKSPPNVEFRNDFMIIYPNEPISWSTNFNENELLEQTGVTATTLIDFTATGLPPSPPQSCLSACASIKRRANKMYRLDENNPPPNITPQQITKAKKSQKFHLKRKNCAEKTSQYNAAFKELTGLFPKMVNGNGHINPEIVIQVTEKAEKFRELCDIILQSESTQDKVKPKGRQSKKDSQSAV